jgi:hypothetical protein
MAFIAASIASISDDTGSNTNDFVTQDRTLNISGFAIGNGTLGFWMIVPSLSPTPFFLGSLTIGNADPHIWTFTGLSGAPLPDDNYTILITNGTGFASTSTPLDTQGIVVDNAAPIVTIGTVEGDDTLSAPETNDGLQVSGTAAGANGRTITIEVRDGLDNLLFTRTATVSGNAWSTTFNSTQAASLTGTDYSIHASVSDLAGNTGTADHDFASTVCFMAGTMIRTPDGEVAVETIKHGDMVLTADGRSVPVTWLGVQTVSRLFSDPNRVWPIRIKAGALSDNVPSRDLLISPDHAILVDDVLVQAGALINGSSIVREGNVPATFTYYHVETEDHSLILAHDVPSETFVDNVNRMGFDNWSEHQALYPQGKAIVEMAYPRAQSLRQVPVAIRQRLNGRAAAQFADVSAA